MRGEESSEDGKRIIISKSHISRQEAVKKAKPPIPWLLILRDLIAFSVHYGLTYSHSAALDTL